MARYPDRHSAALPALAAAQRVHGWCSPEAIVQVACVMRLTPAYLTSVATFYDMFELAPTGAHSVYVCTNISCSLRGADELYAALEEAVAGDGDINLRHFECLGACDIAPMVSVDQRYYGPLEIADAAAPGRGPARRPRAAARAGARAAPGRPALPGRRAVSPQILFEDLDEPGLATLEVYERRGGYQALRRALTMEPDAIVAELEASGLRGRGGAGFPAGRKASFLPKGDMDKYLVCNADESEPGTFKDRELLQKSPHMLIEGIVIAARGAGITRAFIYIRGEYEAQAKILDARDRAGDRRRLPRRPDPGQRHLARPRAPPRRRRLHLRRGDGAARLAGGQARQPAAEAAVPRDPGPLPRTDADQQRRDALDDAGDHPHGGRRVREAGRARIGGHEARLGLRACAPARQLRGRARHALARDHLRDGRRAARGPLGQALVSRAARARRC